MRKYIGVFFLVLCMVGCHHATVAPVNAVNKCLAVADAAAERHLAEMNRSDQWAWIRKEVGSPFAMADYARSAFEATLDGRDILGVSYNRKKQFGIKGDPNGFRLHVFMDTGEVVFWTTSGNIIQRIRKKTP